MKVLILFAHPALHKSRANKELIKGLSDMNDVTFHDLYQEYPDFYIDVKKEQEFLETHDVIIFQFPMFWYSTPALLKEWQDLVLEHGWAYGSKGNALKGKFFLCAITTGGPQNSYEIGGFHDHTLNQLLAPISQTATLCKMTVLPPVVLHGAHAIDDEGILKHKKLFQSLLNAFTDNSFKSDEVLSLSYINAYNNIKE